MRPMRKPRLNDFSRWPEAGGSEREIEGSTGPATGMGLIVRVRTGASPGVAVSDSNGQGNEGDDDCGGEWPARLGQ